MNDTGSKTIPSFGDNAEYSTSGGTSFQEMETSLQICSLSPENFELNNLEEYSTRCAKLWPAVPLDLLLDGIDSISPFPFARTASSNVMKGYLYHTAVAMKTFRPSGAVTTKVLKRFYFEVLLWSKLKHPNIIPFLGLYMKSPSQIFMVSRFMNNGALPGFLASNPHTDRLSILTGVADAITYLHTLPVPVLHGDIRGMNVLVGEGGEPYLIDMGYSLIMDAKSATFSPLEHMFAGSVRWTPEERLRHGEFPLTLKSDVYSFACLCVAVFSGKLPFDHLSNDGAVIIEVLVKRKYPSRPEGPEARQLTDSLWDVLEKCFARDPAARPSMDYVFCFIASLALTATV